MSDTRLEKLLNLTIEEDASDLHISVGHPPVLRSGRQLIPLVKKKKITFEESKKMAFELMTEEQKDRLMREKGVDFSYNFQGKARFRVNTFFERGNISIALRLIPTEIPTIEELNLPSVLHEFTRRKQGFVLVTGPSSHGKSTTLAALIDEINRTRADHIITIEDPIEYVFDDDRSIIDQREVGQDALGFHKALRSSFRQDPDVIMVGEMRDVETFAAALTAAETGHLVFSTLHTSTAVETVTRIVDMFPADRESQVISQLASTLRAVICQQLLPRVDGGRIGAREVMINNNAITNLIRSKKFKQIYTSIQTGRKEGMITMNKSIDNLLEQGYISKEVADRKKRNLDTKATYY